MRLSRPSVISTPGLISAMAAFLTDILMSRRIINRSHNQIGLLNDSLFVRGVVVDESATRRFHNAHTFVRSGRGDGADVRDW